MTSAVMSSRPRLWLGLRLGMTCAILVLLWVAVDGPAVAKAIAGVSPVWLAAAAAALLVQTALSAQRWRVTAAQLGQDLPAKFAVKEYFLSQALNQALPGAVMGDAARAVRARAQTGLLVATQAVVFERLAGQIAMFLTLTVAFLATYLADGGLDWPPGWSAALGAAILGGAALPVLAFFLNAMRVSWAAGVVRWLRPLGVALFSGRVLPAQVLLGAAITFCNLAAFAFAGRSVGIHMSPVEVAALVPVILFAMLIPFTISGWGIREGAAALVFPLAGFSAADGVAASIVFGVALLLAVLPGTLMVMAR
ncbi:lysylphosphatidylglycerol synthase transmembrane domain-containing protein [Marivita hallyeonensis]|uniref:Uncharacterized membrane protein YbhN, UPF0104 family n=1 Tax=Marivita hallyeonensis TaxID=996342 RepID=A0A1M5S7M0_9RHOB|nr:lysylphosphatidylglycerol synthase transmembrane domain-containing protein [Marivita hallyeonensis]SHH34494.1 Uncharacterized membrane protein YbhN, UPF0104 family [Marivita hallyeonensis]